MAALAWHPRGQHPPCARTVSWDIWLPQALDPGEQYLCPRVTHSGQQGQEVLGGAAGVCVQATGQPGWAWVLA